MKRRIFAFLLSMVLLCSAAFPGFTANAADTVPETTVETEATEATTAPTEETTTPTEATTAPTEATTVPTEETTVPTEATTVPTEETTVPTEETTVPTEETTVPTEETTVPTEETTVPTEETTVPTEEAPVEYPEQTLLSEGFKAVGNMPEGTVLSVTALRPELNEYIHNEVLGLDPLPEGYTAKAYDIKLVDEVTGAEFVPTSPVSLTVYGAGTNETSEVTIHHLKYTSWQQLDAMLEEAKAEPGLLDMISDLITGEEEAEKQEILVENPAVEVGKDYIYFQTDSFSVFYIVSYTEPEPIPEQTLSEGPVTVVGEIPEGVTLEVTNMARMSRMMSTAQTSQSALAQLDITLRNEDGTEWQPEDGNTVSVTLNAAELGLKDGHSYIVSHVHQDEELGETTTNFVAVPEGGEMKFEVNGFSYFLVFDGEPVVTLPNVEAFYTVNYDAGSGNDSLQFLGLYYDNAKPQNVHFLLAVAGNQKLDDIEKQVQNLYVDGSRFPVASTPHNKYPTLFTSVTFKDESGNPLKSVPVSMQHGSLGFYDFNMGHLVIDEDFRFSVSKQGEEPDKSNGWNITGIADVDISYNITKQVAKGTAANVAFADSITVERGDWVIYKISVNNTGTMPLSNMKVTDILPDDVFVPGSAKMSIDGENGAIGNWQPFNSTLFANYSSAGNFSRQLYIKAQVRPDLNINTPTSYVNKAKIEGNNMPTDEDSATIVVNPPKSGTLTVSKAVSSANPNDPAPNDTFEFTILSTSKDVTATTEFKYTVDGGAEMTVANGGTFELRAGQSAKFTNFPTGDFTVTEMNAENYTTTVNGTAGKTYSYTMTSNGSPVVTFLNEYNMRAANLEITKLVEKAYENDTIPADDAFTFRVSITGEAVPGSYSYTIGTTSGTLTNGGTISLKADETAVITGIPVGAEFEVEEVLGSDYELTKINNETPAEGVTNTSGKMDANGAEVEFLNTYKRHRFDMTVEKVVTTNGTEDNPVTAPENQKFSFMLTLDPVESAEKQYTVVFEGEKAVAPVLIHSGEAFLMEAGYKATIKDLPLGASYTVQEANLAPGFTVEQVTVNGKAVEADVASGTITAKDTAEAVVFTNKYSLYNLTINKFCDIPPEADQSFVFKVTGPEGFAPIDVVIHSPATSITIKGLLPGEYTVTEEMGWAWRYTGGGTKTADLTEGDDSVNFYNMLDNLYWLSGCAYAKNDYTT